MKICEKVFEVHGGGVHTREVLHASNKRFFIRTWSVLKSEHGQEVSITLEEALEFVREAGVYRLDFSRNAYPIELLPSAERARLEERIRQLALKMKPQPQVKWQYGLLMR